MVVALMMLVVSAGEVSAQNARRGGRRAAKNADSEKIEEILDSAAMAAADSLKAVRDSLHRADSLFRADSMAMLSKSSLDMPAFTGARDSIIEDFSEGHRIIYYYGDVTVKYGTMELTADYMQYDLGTGILYAHGTKDTLTGEWVGQPKMSDNGKTYEMEELRYNFNTRKSRITNMKTQEDDGLLHGQNIKMMPDNSINITKGKYTVCDAEHPHYYLALTAAKVMTKPTQKTVFGPAYPVIADVPIPLGLPFGFIPKRPDRATGFLMPSFGEETSRGFYARDAGMYFVIGDYFDLSITGDIYTMGSWALDVNSRYKVNYKCNGNFALTYSNDQTGEKGAPDFFQTKNFSLKWSHSQDAKARPGTTFSASVNFSSPSNSKYNSRSVNEALQNQISSSISYAKNFGGKVNLSLNALHSQNSRDSSYAFTLPNVSLSVTRFYPFKKKHRVGKEKFYEKFSLGYSTSFQNKFNFKVSDFQAIDSVTRERTFSVDSMKTKLPDKINSGMGHNFQIGLPNFTLLKYFNFTPSLQYGMNWMFSKGDQYLKDVVGEDGKPLQVFDKNGMAVLDENGNIVTAKELVKDTGSAFNAFGATHTYSGSLSMSTRLYGMFLFGKQHKVQAIRHVVSPSMSFSYSPDKAKYFNGWRTLDAYYDKNGTYHAPTDYNIYSTSTHNSVSAPGKGKTGSVSLSIGNNLEAKVRDLRDTTGKGTKKIKLIDNLNLNTSYNFLADSLRLSNLGVSMSTSVFGKVSINGNLNFDPYAVNEQGKKINKFEVTQSGNLARLTNASASLSYSLSGEGKTRGSTGEKDGAGGASSTSGGNSRSNPAQYYQRIYYHPITGEYIPGGYLYYLNSEAPWSVNFNYSFNYSKSYQYSNNELHVNNKFTQTLGISGNVKVTRAMAINLTTGVDLMALKLTTTQLSATYDLHCFNISVSWVPTGQWESWSFRIAANAAALADLLRYKKSSSYWDN